LTCDAAHILPSPSALALLENCALGAGLLQRSCATGCSSPRAGSTGTMTWLEILLVVALLLLALGLSR
jgi:hypothetical protein